MLRELMEEYYDLNERKKDIEKKLDKIKKEIKPLAEQHELVEGNLKAYVVVQDRSTVNDDRLIDLLKHLGMEFAIDLKPVPNHEKVEDMVFNGMIKTEDFEKCIDKKFVNLFMVKKI